VFDFIRRPHRTKLRETPLPPEWAAIIEKNVPLAKHLTPEERARLDGLVQIFLDEKSFEGFSEIIRKSGADVIAVQEGNDALYAYLKKHLAKEYPHVYVFSNQAAAGLAWVSKVPLTNTVVLPPHGGGWSFPTESRA